MLKHLASRIRSTRGDPPKNVAQLLSGPLFHYSVEKTNIWALAERRSPHESAQCAALRVLAAADLARPHFNRSNASDKRICRPESSLLIICVGLMMPDAALAGSNIKIL
jgi:hypothetical protein